LGSASEAATLLPYGYYSLSSNQFYAEIPAFDDFPGIADGRYKDVNMIGAACISAVLNISQEHSIPYVFGGDGATLMVPSNDVESATRVLLGVRDLAPTALI
jgi:hypothetical protein